MAISISGTTLTFNDNTTQTTAATGTVSSVATGNGLSGGTITTSGTLSVACPGVNTVGSYGFGGSTSATGVWPVSGSNYSAGSGTNQFMAYFVAGGGLYERQNIYSGTWKWMVNTNNPQHGDVFGLICRVS